jgi:hypothetical protein
MINKIQYQNSLTYLFVVYLDVADSDPDGLIKFLTRLFIDLLDAPGDNSPVLLTVLQSEHGVGFTSTRLAVAHDGAVVASHHTLH